MHATVYVTVMAGLVLLAALAAANLPFLSQRLFGVWPMRSGDKGLAEVIIAKQRSGPTGTIKLKFFGEYTRFDNLARDSVGSFE